MTSFSRELVGNLVPAILAGIIGGFGAYVAVKVDIAILMSNQAGFKEDLKIMKDVSERLVKQEGRMEFFQYQLDSLRDQNVKL